MNRLVTEIYDDLDGINDVRIDMVICDTEEQTPSIFTCHLQSGKSLMIINITNDGTKTSKFASMHRRPRWFRIVRTRSSAVFSFLKSIFRPAIAAVIGGSVGYITKGPVGLALGAGIGVVATERVIDTGLGYFLKKGHLQ